MAKEDFIDKRLSQTDGLNKILGSIQDSLGVIKPFMDTYPELVLKPIEDTIDNLSIIQQKCSEKNIEIPDNLTELKNKFELLKSKQLEISK